jgi:hypothetical protein
MLPPAILDFLDGVADGELDSLPDCRSAPLSGKPPFDVAKGSGSIVLGYCFYLFRALTAQFCIYACGGKDVELAEVPSPEDPGVATLLSDVF